MEKTNKNHKSKECIDLFNFTFKTILSSSPKPYTIEFGVSSVTNEFGATPEVFDRLCSQATQFHDERHRTTSQFASLQHTLDQILLRLPLMLSICESHGPSNLNPSVSHLDHHTQVSFSHLEPSCSGSMLGIQDSMVQRNEIPIFHGVYPYGWIVSVERHFRIERFTETKKLELVSASLESVALEWYHWERDRLPFQNWLHFKERLLLRFGNLRVTGPSPSLFCIKQKGTIAEYVQRFEELSAQVTGLDDSKLQGIFLCGLTQGMQEKVHKMRPQNLPQIISFVQSMESHDAAVALGKEPCQAECSKSMGEEELCSVTDSIPKPESWQSKSSLLAIELRHQQELLQDKQSSREMGLIKESSGSNKMLVMNPPVIKEKNNVLVDCLYHQSTSVTDKRKPRKYPKAWKYKFKHQLFDSKDRKSVSFCSQAKVGLERKRRRFWSLRLQKQAHMFDVDALVTISLNETVIVQPSCAHQLVPHRLRRLPSRWKQRKFFKSWRFKFKNKKKSNMEVEMAPMLKERDLTQLQVHQQLLQAQQYTWNNDVLMLSHVHEFQRRDHHILHKNCQKLAVRQYGLFGVFETAYNVTINVILG